MTESGTPVHFDGPAMAAVKAHALRDYPSECCGLLTSTGGPQVVHPCQNVQDRLHALDPATHPRTSRTAYRVDDVAVARILRETESAGGRLLAIYHSHVDVDAYFSEEDQSAATFFGEPAYPGVVYLVVAVTGGRVTGLKAFAWAPASRRYAEVAMAVAG